MFKKAQASLMIAAVVSVVAVLGLVLTQNASHQGAQTVVFPAFEDTLVAKSGRLADYQNFDMAREYGSALAQDCLAKAKYEGVNTCCKRSCVSACDFNSDDLCAEKCSNRCQQHAYAAQGIQLPN